MTDLTFDDEGTLEYAQQAQKLVEVWWKSPDRSI